jgi:DNA (cytosine-5)-methyltransferase 1
VTTSVREPKSLRVAGLFAGIGGIELGLARSGHQTVLLNEIDPVATAVLRDRFPGVPHWEDVTTLEELPSVDLVTAGFPCQDLSQAGRKVGITGERSGLVDEVFRLVGRADPRPEWILLENVSYMLRLDRGQAMRHVVDGLEALGYTWAYRVVDARAFGVPQRRQRVLFVASLHEDPRIVLFADDSAMAYDDRVRDIDEDAIYGFYWTEGLRGLGWTRNAVPTVKGGSQLGIPSAPGIWIPDTGEVGTPEIEDGERLQGFDSDWTAAALDVAVRPGIRWRLVGNAVCVPMAEWLGRRLKMPAQAVEVEELEVGTSARWPLAAWGANGSVFAVQCSPVPFACEPDLRKFLSLPLRPLSVRAANGFLSRARRSTTLRFAPGFLEALDDHVQGCER